MHSHEPNLEDRSCLGRPVAHRKNSSFSSSRHAHSILPSRHAHSILGILGMLTAYCRIFSSSQHAHSILSNLLRFTACSQHTAESSQVHGMLTAYCLICPGNLLPGGALAAEKAELMCALQLFDVSVPPYGLLDARQLCAIWQKNISRGRLSSRYWEVDESGRIPGGTQKSCCWPEWADVLHAGRKRDASDPSQAGEGNRDPRVGSHPNLDGNNV